MRAPGLAPNLAFALAGTLLLTPAHGLAEPSNAGTRSAGASFAFTKVADSTGSIADISPYIMAINGAGAVAVWVILDDLSMAIVRFDGQTMTTIADTSTFDAFYALAVNDAGTVAFSGDPVGGTIGVFAGNGGSLVTLGPVPADPLDPMYTLLALDNSGLALMQRHQGVLGNAVALVAGNGGPVATIYDQASLPPDDLPSGGNFASGDLGESGGLAFVSGPAIGSRWFVYRGSLAGTALVRVASPALTSPGNRLPDFGLGAINDSDTVAISEGGGGFTGVYSGRDEASLALIASTDDPYSSFGSGGPAINGSGQVVFQAVLDGGSGSNTGIFTGPDPVADRVIAKGDSLDGSTVAFVETNSRCLSEIGQILFYAILDDGRQGLFLAWHPIFADGFESGDTSRRTPNIHRDTLPG